jgi:hypothetical protein
MKTIATIALSTVFALAAMTGCAKQQQPYGGQQGMPQGTSGGYGGGPSMQQGQYGTPPSQMHRGVGGGPSGTSGSSMQPGGNTMDGGQFGGQSNY